MNISTLRNTQTVGRCIRCNDQQVLWDLLCGFSPCPICYPEGNVCGMCGGDIERFEGQYHSDCMVEYEYRECCSVSPQTIVE